MLFKLWSTILINAGIKAGLKPLMAHLLAVDRETSNDKKEKTGRNKQ